MSPRVRLGCGLAAALLAAVAVAAWSLVRGAIEGGEVEPMARRLPADTRAVFAVRGWLALAVKLGPGVKEGLGPEAFRALRDAARDETGQDVDRAASWLTSWIDPTRPALAAWIDGVGPRGGGGEVRLLVPVRDEVRAHGWLGERVAARGLAVSPAPRAAGSGRCSAAEGPGIALAWCAEDGVLTVGFVPGPGSRATDPGGLGRPTGPALADDPAWQEVTRGLGDDWHALAFASAAGRREVSDWLGARAGRRTVSEVDARIPPGALGAALQVTGGHTEVRLALDLPEEAGPPPWLVATPLARPGRLPAVPGVPELVARVAVDPAALWARADADPSAREDLREGAAEVKDSMGIDLEAEVIGVLDGTAGIASFPSSGDGAPFEAVAWLGVKDEAAARGLLARLAGSFRPTGLAVAESRVEGATWHGAGAFGVEVRFAAVGGQAVFVLGKRFAEVARALAGGGAGSVGDRVPSADGRAALGSDVPAAAWLSRGFIEQAVGRLPSAMGSGAAPPAADLLFTAGPGAPGVLATLRLGLPAREIGMAAGRALSEGVRTRAMAGAEAEVLAHLDTLRALQKARTGGEGPAATLAATPADVPRGGDAPFSGPGAGEFRSLGWEAPPRVRCRYEGGPVDHPLGLPDFQVRATCDLDGDGRPAVFEASAHEPAHRVSAAGEY